MNKFRILIVDDDGDVAEYIENVFRDSDKTWEFEIKVMTDSKAARELLQREPYDVISLDNMMPGLTGKELIMEIRKADHLNQHTPILFVSGYHSRLDLEGDLAVWEEVYFIDKPDVEGKLNRLATLLCSSQAKKKAS